MRLHTLDEVLVSKLAEAIRRYRAEGGPAGHTQSAILARHPEATSAMFALALIRANREARAASREEGCAQ